MAAHEPSQRLQVAERRRPDAESIRIRRLAVADDEVSELAFWRLDRVVGLTGGWLDQPRDFADDRPLWQAFSRLPDDPQRLPELLHPDQISIVRVAARADRHVELHFIVRGVRLVLPHVAGDA